MLAALREAGLAPVVRDYQADPPDTDDLRAAVRATALPAADLVRRKSDDFKQLGDEILKLREADLVALLASRPAMIERPLVFGPDGRARLCRPKEVVFEMMAAAS